MSDTNIGKEKLISDFQSLLKDVDALIKEGTGHLGEKAQVIRDRVDQGVRRARVQLEELDHVVRDRSREAARVTDDFVHDHPWESAGVGFGVGLLLGILLGKR